MIEFSQQTTGMTVSYIELSNGLEFLCHWFLRSLSSSVAVTLVINDVAKVFCALFHDRDDGCAFGRLICSEILTAFTQVTLSPPNFFNGFRNLQLISAALD